MYLHTNTDTIIAVVVAAIIVLSKTKPFPISYLVVFGTINVGRKNPTADPNCKNKTNQHLSSATATAFSLPH